MATPLAILFVLFVLATTGLHHHGTFRGQNAAASSAFTKAASPAPAPFCPICQYLTHPVALAAPPPAPGLPLLRSLAVVHRPPTVPGFQTAPRVRQSRAPPALLLSKTV